MMIPIVEDESIDVDDDESKRSSVINWLAELSPKKKVFGCMAIAAIGGQLLWSPQVKNFSEQVVTPKPSAESVADLPDESVDLAHVIIQIAEMDTGLIEKQAQQFSLSAQRFMNEDGHRCSQYTAIQSCLETFLESRRIEMTALALTPLPVDRQLKRLSEIHTQSKAIILAMVLATDPKQRNDIERQFISTVAPYIGDGVVPSPATLATTLGAFSESRQLQEIQNKEALRKAAIANQVELTGEL